MHTAWAGLVSTAAALFVHAPPPPDWSDAYTVRTTALGPHPPESKWHVLHLAAGGSGWTGLRERWWTWAPEIAQLFPPPSLRLARVWLLFQQRQQEQCRGSAAVLPAALRLVVLQLADHRVALEHLP